MQQGAYVLNDRIKAVAFYSDDHKVEGNALGNVGADGWGQRLVVDADAAFPETL